MEQIIKILAFILNSFVHIWPYLLITIPLAVIVQLSGAAKYINNALSKNPLVSIVLATLLGALSPFCSCGVIPVIASLLIGGVPLAPVMSFWIASPSMDPEIFFLSAATIGWKLSVWRLAATFVISISAGFTTHFAMKRGIFGTEILRAQPVLGMGNFGKNLLFKLVAGIKRIFTLVIPQKKGTVQLIGVKSPVSNSTNASCCINIENISPGHEPVQSNKSCACAAVCTPKEEPFFKKMLREIWKAFSMVAQFMALAFLINALIEFYLPKDYVGHLLGNDSPFSVLIAALVGIPVYTSNLTALPLVSGLLSLGMNQGAALSFLIAGPVTTLPAMLAVWGIVKPKVFLFYLIFPLLGAIVFGYLYNFVN